MSNPTRRIAFAASDTLGLQGRLSPHFGRCHSWVLVEVGGEEPFAVRILANPLSGSHDCTQLASLLAEMEVDEVVAGGLGMKAQRALAEKGIQAATGFEGSVEECLRSYLAGLRPPESLCSGHHPHG
jgi:predicted Fe-Mo cluster-binding NifX family protein